MNALLEILERHEQARAFLWGYVLEARWAQKQLDLEKQRRHFSRLENLIKKVNERRTQIEREIDIICRAMKRERETTRRKKLHEAYQSSI